MADFSTAERPPVPGTEAPAAPEAAPETPAEQLAPEGENSEGEQAAE